MKTNIFRFKYNDIKNYGESKYNRQKSIFIYIYIQKKI